MKKASQLFFTGLLGLSIASAFNTSALAHEAGDIIVRAGLTSVEPDDGSSGVQVATVGNVGMKVEADSGAALGLNFVYMLNSNLAIELLAATPFSHDINLLNTSDNALGLGDGLLGETKHLPPTLSALYYFDSGSDFQPYAGLGVNYTIFFEDDFADARVAQTFSNLDLDDSFGLAAQLGFDYTIDDNWLFNASVRYIDIGTEADFQVLGLNSTVDVDIDPFVYSLMVGYKF